jgi:Protein of unknown function (DUF3223)
MAFGLKVFQPEPVEPLPALAIADEPPPRIAGYNTKTALREYFGALLRRLPIGEVVPDSEASELMWLLGQHPKVTEKIGCGVAFFTVKINPPYGSRGFWFTRIDGSTDDFSYLVCITPPSAKDTVLKAMRAEVGLDIRQAKIAYFEQHAVDGVVPCAISGAPVTIDDADCDHAEPYRFHTLATTFLKANEIEPAPGMVFTDTNNEHRLVDRALAAKWVAFHHDLACLQIVARRVNTAEGYKSKIKKGTRQLQLSVKNNA